MAKRVRCTRTKRTKYLIAKIFNFLEMNNSRSVDINAEVDTSSKIGITSQAQPLKRGVR